MYRMHTIAATHLWIVVIIQNMFSPFRLTIQYSNLNAEQYIKGMTLKEYEIVNQLPESSDTALFFYSSFKIKNLPVWESIPCVSPYVLISLMTCLLKLGWFSELMGWKVIQIEATKTVLPLSFIFPYSLI